MSAKRKRRRTGPPPYCHHKSSGQAYVNLSGKEHYLGKFDSPESHQKYARLIAEHSAGAIHEKGKPVTAATGITVVELVAAYMKFAKTYYVKNGVETDEVDCIKSAVRDLVALYGDEPIHVDVGPGGTPAEGYEGFGPLKLQAVRERMIQPHQKKIGRSGKTIEVRWTRGYINISVNRIRTMFRWGVSKELVRAEVLTALESVAPLKKGRCDAVDNPKRHAVSDEHIELVKGIVTERYRDMIEVARLTGARPGELVKLTGEMIDRETYQTDGVWTAEILDHKMAHEDRERILVFGPKSQLILRRHLPADPTKRLFPIQRATFSNNIKAACDQLGIPRFTAHWLRHTAGTRIREDHGLEQSQATLGHANADTTEIYSEVQLSKAIQVARDAG
jgi:integrase